MKAGAANIDITPPAGLAMSGFGARTARAVGAHDALTVRAVAVDDTAIVCVDLVGLHEDSCARIRERCCLPADRVVVTASHTHGGPVIMPGRLGGPLDETYLAGVEDACVRAIDRAVAAQVSANLLFGVGADPGVARNRRHDGGIVDPALPVLRLVAGDGSAIAVIVAYACHPVVLGADNLLWTADYPGFVRRAIERQHPGAMALFLTGCTGDANTGHKVTASFNLAAQADRSFSNAERIGERIAAMAIAAPASPMRGPVTIDRSTLALPFTATELAPWPARVSVLQWCGVRIVALPGEIFAATALRIRDAIDGPVVTIAYADGVPGYFPPADEFAHGGYEVAEAYRFYGMPAAFASGCAERLADAAVALARGMPTDNMEDLRRRALAVMPGGVSSNVRALEQPLFLSRASGAHVWDESGRRFIDYVCGYGAIALGYAPPGLNDAMTAALVAGIQHAAVSRTELEAAEAFCAAVPSVQSCRFHGSATEALQTAFRIARTATGRPTIVKFARHYHGWVLPTDVEILSTEGGNSPPGFAVLPWNDSEKFSDFMQRRGGEVAAVVTEPVMANQGCFLPEPGWLELLQSRTQAVGGLFIMDEVVTGFRVALGGVQELQGLSPDLSVFGKAMAGGAPMGATGGRRDLMELLAPGKVGHGGTFNGSTLSMAAVLWCIGELRRRGPAFFAGLAATGQLLMQGLSDTACRAGVSVTTRGPGAVFWLAFDGDDATDVEPATYRKFRLAMHEKGIRIGPGGRWYVNAAHGDAEIEATLVAAAAAFRDAAA
jgi:neutral ceramidase